MPICFPVMSKGSYYSINIWHVADLFLQQALKKEIKVVHEAQGSCVQTHHLSSVFQLDLFKIFKRIEMSGKRPAVFVSPLYRHKT